VSTAVASTPVGTARRLGVTLVGPVVWATQLIVAYAGGALLCRHGYEAEPFIVIVTVVAAVIVAVALVLSIRRGATGPAAAADDGSAARWEDGDGRPVPEELRERSGDRRVEDERFLGHVATGLNALYLVTIVLGGVWAVIEWC
jgi:hypothetical protein